MLEGLKSALAAFGVDWADFKLFATHVSGISHDAMHVMIGVIAQLVMVAVFRRTLASFLPLGIILAVELLNEWNDLHVERWPAVAMQWGEMAKDIGLTMALPTLLLVLARTRPGWFGLCR